LVCRWFRVTVVLARDPAFLAFSSSYRTLIDDIPVASDTDGTASIGWEWNPLSEVALS
jgi:hypothetical protein